MPLTYFLALLITVLAAAGGAIWLTMGTSFPFTAMALIAMVATVLVQLFLSRR